jgi:hypothetical protein
MKVLIGNTGLVGSTLCGDITFNLKFNSSNLHEFIEKVVDGDELYLSCLPATKWLVNKNVTKDFENMINIIDIIKTKKYSKVILISTIDVYNSSKLKSNEDVIPIINNLNYGNNRYLFELLVKEFVKTNDLKIFRLPALFNKRIKKNILYDLINNNNLESVNSNSSFQWYNLDNLHKDIEILSHQYPNEMIFNLFTEPIESMDIINLFPHNINKVSHLDTKIIYDFTTKFNKTGYHNTKEQVLTDIKNLINEISFK